MPQKPACCRLGTLPAIFEDSHLNSTLFPAMGTITKRDLVVQISDQTGLTQHQVFDVLQLFLDNVTSYLAQNNEVVLRNFGTFEIRVTKPKIGRNPNSPEN